MARKPRVHAKSNIYHVIIRGNNKQIIFEDDEDRNFFMYRLEYYKIEYKFKILAYCLMDNHVHLVIQVCSKSISAIMQALETSYVKWFNMKYHRSGHLMQDRFKSEPIENEGYLLTVIRYVHNNPIKAGLCSSCAAYKYSSYNEYIHKAKLVDSAICLAIMNKNDFVLFHQQQNNDICLELEEYSYRLITDREALNFLRELLSKHFIEKINSMDKKMRDAFIRKFRARGMSIKQISRLTGLSIGVISRQRLSSCIC